MTGTLKLGDAAPGFTLSAANRPEVYHLENLLKRGPVVIEFLRGTWRPYCVKRMAQLEPHKDEILSRGSLVLIAAQKRGCILSSPEKFPAKKPTAFPFLRDEDRKVTKSYGVFTALSSDSINIAHPATFVVNPNGKNTYVYVGSNQLDRAPIEGILEAFLAAAHAAGIHQT